jgi:signal transduction histidine kinase
MIPNSAPEFASPPQQASELSSLLRPVAPIGPTTTVSEAADRMQQPAHAGLLCLPVVDQGRVLGTISRHQLTTIFLHRFGRELYGARPVTQLMNPEPLQVVLDAPLESAAQYVAANIGTPLSEDFVLIYDGRYAGMGVVIDLLGAMQDRISRGAAQLEQAYRQLKSSQSALVQSEKMASLGQMVAGVAHEINTPLGYVRNNVELIQGVFVQLTEVLRAAESLSAMLADEQVEAEALDTQIAALNGLTGELREAQIIEDTEALLGDTLFGVDTIKELVVNLRNFSRSDTARSPNVNLNDCVEQTLTIAGPMIKNRVQLVRQLGSLPAVSCSPSQINQVLLNLVTNAVQACEGEDARVLLRTEADERAVRIMVQDNGRGISPEHLKKIFDPFFTTKPLGQGTGLGLSICYQIIQAHGGQIQVASVVGRGTRFVITLPIPSTAAAA